MLWDTLGVVKGGHCPGTLWQMSCNFVFAYHGITNERSSFGVPHSPQ